MLLTLFIQRISYQKLSFNVRTYEVRLQCLKRHMAEETEKAKFPPFSKMQRSCNNACKKTLFSNMICFGFSFPYFHTNVIS